jgi:SAM-dependent methyltransferase
MNCSVCGGTAFVERLILWDKLVAEWQLAPHERSYIDRQQGTCCTSCGANLRSIALADAIRTAVGTTLTLTDFVATSEAKRLLVLEINEAGNLSPVLRQLTGHTSAVYPEVDIHAMPYSDDAFDLVVHSDTLEHVANPIRALDECRRVLRPGAPLCFTIPTVVERLSRSRTGLSKSYHGSPETATDDYAVQTEFGADMWTYVLRAGFSALSINSVDYPAALALTARKAGPLILASHVEHRSSAQEVT